MAKAKRKPRLKKNPEIADYVVECISDKPQEQRTVYQYFTLRTEARSFAKVMLNQCDRVRIFRMHFTSVSDSKGGRK